MARGRRKGEIRLLGGGADGWITLAHAADRLGVTPAELRQKLDEMRISTHVHPQGGITVIARRDLDILVGRTEESVRHQRTASAAAPPADSVAPCQGTWPIEGILEKRKGVWAIWIGHNRLVVEVDHPAPSRLIGNSRRWLITYRADAPPKVTPDKRSPSERRRDAERLVRGKPDAAPPPARRSVWTISGGLPSLGKRR